MWGDSTATWGDPRVTWGGERPDQTVTLTLHGRVTSVDIATDTTGTTVTARIEPD